MEHLIGTQDLEKLIALALSSAYVKGDKPISLLIVSDRPESGKTETVNRFYGNTGLGFLSDCTAFALWRDFEQQMRERTLKHLIIPEFLTLLSRSRETVGSLISTLQELTEDGATGIHTGFLPDLVPFDPPVVVGVIACMPRNAYDKHRLEWEVSGFLSRFMVVTFKYSDDTVDYIFDSIEKREYLKYAKIDLKLRTEVEVTIPPEVAHECRTLSESITNQARRSGSCYGFRELKNILRCVAANVILDANLCDSTRTTAEMWDFNEVKRLSYLVNEQFNTLSNTSPVLL